MFFLGLLLPICFISGWTGVTIPTQWVLLSCVLPFSLWKRGKLTPFHWLGIMFIGYAFLSMLWTTNQYEGIFGLWQVLIWALAFWYGTVAISLVPLWKGLAVGLSISTFFAIAQAFGYQPILNGEAQTAGLLFNNTVASASIALVLIALVCVNLWHYMPLLIVGLALTQSRGGILILGIALICKYIHWLLALTIVIVGASILSIHEIPSDSWRLQIWGYAIRGLTILGWGPDAFSSVYFIICNADKYPSFSHPEFVHNDYLQLWFNFGIAAIIPYIILIYAATRTRHLFWPVMVAYGALGTFYFPLFTPVPAFIGCVLAGHICRGYDPIQSIGKYSRPSFLPWLENLERKATIHRSGVIPLEQLHPQSEA